MTQRYQNFQSDQTNRWVTFYIHCPKFCDHLRIYLIDDTVRAICTFLSKSSALLCLYHFRCGKLWSQPECVSWIHCSGFKTRSSANADNRLDAFSGQSRSTNMVPFHMLHIVSYCAIVTLCLSEVFTIFVFKKFHDLEMGVKGHSRSLRVVSFDRLCMVSY